MASNSPLDVKVETLETEVKEIKDSIRVFQNEMRASLSSLSTQFNDRQRTPWGTLASCAAVLLTIIGAVSYQAIYPLHEKLTYIQSSIVPRNEVEVRFASNDRRVSVLEGTMMRLEERRYDEMVQSLRDAKDELHMLKGRAP